MKDYLIQIDALRFYAVFSVVISHLYPSTLPTVDFFIKLYEYLPGVQLFFCISGFLITGILVKGIQISSKSNLFKVFYYRRFLRIFPIYYLTIFLLYFLNIGDYREWFLYDFFYVTNIIQALQGNFAGTIAPHFWSLAVEEQFYIFWPLLLTLSKNKKYHIVLASSLFLLGCFSVFYTSNSFFVARTFGCLAYLGSGALLAILWLYFKEYVQNSVIFLNYFILMLFLFLVIITFFKFYFSEDLSFLIKILAIPILTLKFALGFKNKLLKPLLESRVILYLGKISYGLYVYHLLVHYPLVFLFKLFSIPFQDDSFAFFVYKILLAILVSIISWEFFEKKINLMKNRYSY